MIATRRFVLLALVLAACGSSSGPLKGAGGTSGSAAGTSGGTAGTSGSAAGTSGGTAGMMVSDAGRNDAGRIPCGTTARGCNPAGGSPICDSANNRCVECLSDTTCTDPTSAHCDVMGGTCEQCLTDMHCAAGEVCQNNNCRPTCTTNANCATDGGGGRPYCSATTSMCVECMTDAHCAGNATSPFCSTTRARCVECRTVADCAAGMTCSTNGSCRAPSDGGQSGRDAEAPADARAGE
jgi:Cys-rich repeat protein